MNNLGATAQTLFVVKEKTTAAATRKENAKVHRSAVIWVSVPTPKTSLRLHVNRACSTVLARPKEPATKQLLSVDVATANPNPKVERTAQEPRLTALVARMEPATVPSLVFAVTAKVSASKKDANATEAGNAKLGSNVSKATAANPRKKTDPTAASPSLAALASEEPATKARPATREPVNPLVDARPVTKERTDVLAKATGHVIKIWRVAPTNDASLAKVARKDAPVAPTAHAIATSNAKAMFAYPAAVKKIVDASLTIDASPVSSVSTTAERSNAKRAPAITKAALAEKAQTA